VATQAVDLALGLLNDSDSGVVRSAAWVLAQLPDTRGCDALIGLRASPDVGIRLAVASGLLLSDFGPEAINALIELGADPDDEVRNWATFSLGQAESESGPVDSAMIRDALRARLQDPFEDARAEAIWGLAVRRDPEGLRLLLDRLSAETWWAGDECAAATILGLNGAAIEVATLCSGIRALLAG
jgi:HEAT repeat protein